jgi:hypothetical protein
MREINEVGERDADFVDTPLNRKLMSWCRDVLRLKTRSSELADNRYEIKASPPKIASMA